MVMQYLLDAYKTNVVFYFFGHYWNLGDDYSVLPFRTFLVAFRLGLSSPRGSFFHPGRVARCVTPLFFASLRTLP